MEDWHVVPQDWVYESGSYPQYYIGDSFTVQATDAQNAYTDRTINVTHYYPSSGGGGGKPVALDLDHDGLEFSGINDSKIFYDINGNGVIRDAGQIIGSIYGPYSLQQSHPHFLKSFNLL